MSPPETGSPMEHHRARAIAGARAAVEALQELGVSALVTGSLAQGRFRIGSDVDLLVTRCPRHLKYTIEGVVEDCLGGVPFDVIYLDEVVGWRAPSFLEKAVHARDLD